MTKRGQVEIEVVEEGPRMPAFRTLFREYSDMPHNVGRSRDPEGEFARLPVPYVPPRGAMLMATLDGKPVGCVVLAALAPPDVCEMKRLYVRDAARGHGVGRQLVEAVMEQGRSQGYRTMRFDTAPELDAAIALYDSMGFHRIPAYHERYADAICFEGSVTD